MKGWGHVFVREDYMSCEDYEQLGFPDGLEVSWVSILTVSP